MRTFSVRCAHKSNHHQILRGMHFGSSDIHLSNLYQMNQRQACACQPRKQPFASLPPLRFRPLAFGSNPLQVSEVSPMSATIILMAGVTRRDEQLMTGFMSE